MALAGLSVPSLLLFGFGLIFVGLAVHAYRQERVVGRRWFILLVSVELVWTVGYGVELMLTDPSVRWPVRAVVNTASVSVPVVALYFFLVFAGEERFVRPATIVPSLAVPALALVSYVTNESTGLAYTEFDLVTTGATTTLVGTPGPGLLAARVGTLLATLLGATILFWTVYRYWSLYRRHLPWLVLLYVVTLGAFVLSMTGNAPIEGLRLIPFTAPLQAVIYGNIIFRYEFLGISSRTQQVGREVAMETLEDGVVVTDADWRLADCNATVGRLFDLPAQPVGTPLSDVLGEETAAALADGATRTVSRGGHTLEVTATTATDQHDDTVGHVVLLRDVTALKRREQRLSVLNRVMRHNVRNEMTVVKGNAQIIEERVDGQPESLAATIRDTADDVVELGDKARALEHLFEDERSPEPLDVTALARDVVDAVAADHPTASFSVLGRETTVTTRPHVLSLALETLVDNGAEHNDAPEPTVSVTVERDGSHAVVTVADDGPGIPQTELDALDGIESKLEHGSGLGLWLVEWSVEQLGGTVEFAVDDGTTVTVRVPDTDRRDGTTSQAVA